MYDVSIDVFVATPSPNEVSLRFGIFCRIIFKNDKWTLKMGITHAYFCDTNIFCVLVLSVNLKVIKKW